VTRGQLPQRAGLPGLNGGGAAAAVPPYRSKDPTNSIEVLKAKAVKLVNICNSYSKSRGCGSHDPAASNKSGSRLG